MPQSVISCKQNTRKRREISTGSVDSWSTAKRAYTVRRPRHFAIKSGLLGVPHAAARRKLRGALVEDDGARAGVEGAVSAPTMSANDIIFVQYFPIFAVISPHIFQYLACYILQYLLIFANIFVYSWSCSGRSLVGGQTCRIGTGPVKGTREVKFAPI